MPKSETLQRLAAIKAIYNRHFNYIRASYPELAWRLSELDSAVTAFEDEVETLLSLNDQLSNERRKPVPDVAEVVAQVLEKIELQSYSEL